MRRIFSVAFLLCIVTLLFTLSTPVSATKPIPVSGTFDYEFTIIDMWSADGKTFIYATEDETWEGSFTGTAQAVFLVIIFSEDFWYVWLRTTFTGEVDGKFGTMIIQLVGKRTYWDEDTFWWYGQWVIISGTDDLADIHGRGTWWGPGYGSEGPDIFYEGQIHFD